MTEDRYYREWDQWLTDGKCHHIFALDLKKKEVNRADLAAQMIGPTGNLRAPTLRRRTQILVGYNPEALEDLLS